MITGIIADTHEPFTKTGYMDFCYDTFDKYHADKIIHIGDLSDNHAISFHPHNPNGYSAGHETEIVIEKVNKWFDMFYDVTMVKGNHDDRAEKSGRASGIPQIWLRSIKEVLGFRNGWDIVDSLVIDDVLYEHGDGFTTKQGALQKALYERQSCVIGHSHSNAGTWFHASKTDTIFGLNVGCGIDNDAYAFSYGKYFKNKPVLSCGIVIDGFQPLCIKMPE